MKKIILFSILGILLISIISAGLIFDSVKDTKVNPEDKIILDKVGIGNYTLKVFNNEKTIGVGILRSEKAPLERIGLFNKSKMTEEEINLKVKELELNWLKRQVENQESKEVVKAPSTTETILVTIKSDSKIGKIGVIEDIKP